MLHQESFSVTPRRLHLSFVALLGAELAIPVYVQTHRGEYLALAMLCVLILHFRIGAIYYERYKETEGVAT